MKKQKKFYKLYYVCDDYDEPYYLWVRYFYKLHNALISYVKCVYHAIISRIFYSKALKIGNIKLKVVK